MCGPIHRSLAALVTGLALCAGLSGSATPPEILYQRESQTLSVQATGQPLLEVLGQLAARTGWHIFVEPDSNPEIRTSFTNVGVGRALEVLVGNMNYALVPQRDAPTKLFVFRTSRDQATLEVRAPTDESPPALTIRRVDNELIVTVEPGTDIEALAKRLGAKVTGQLPGTNTYRLTFENDAAAESARTQLAGQPGVKGVDYNYVVDRPKPPQSLAQGPLPPVKLGLNPPTGKDGIVVGLVDTGVQKLGGDLDQFLLPGKSLAGDAALPSDQLTHGTSMAETILRSIEQSGGNSTSIQILPVDIYGAKGSSTSFDVALGIAAAVNGGANIINLSLGSYGGASYLQEVIREASQKGIVIFAAAGNEPVTQPVYPAAYPDVIAVTAAQGNQLAPYANRGEFVDMIAPGSSVVYFNGQPYGISGTSTATAYASGLAAAVAERQQISLSQAAALISRKYAVRFGNTP
jgi:uncharacterized Zn-binding protein involved in type VI secretion